MTTGDTAAPRTDRYASKSSHAWTRRPTGRSSYRDGLSCTGFSTGTEGNTAGSAGVTSTRVISTISLSAVSSNPAGPMRPVERRRDVVESPSRCGVGDEGAKRPSRRGSSPAAPVVAGRTNDRRRGVTVRRLGIASREFCGDWQHTPAAVFNDHSGPRQHDDRSRDPHRPRPGLDIVVRRACIPYRYRSSRRPSGVPVGVRWVTRPSNRGCPSRQRVCVTGSTPLTTAETGSPSSPTRRAGPPVVSAMSPGSAVRRPVRTPRSS